MKSLPETFPTLGAAFLHRCQASANKVGFRHKVNGKWAEVTFGEQFQYVRTLSVGLMKAGLKAGDSISIIANTSMLWGRFEFAAMGCGAVIIPIYPTNTPVDMEFILKNSESKYVVCDTLQSLEKVISVWKDCPNLKSAIISFELSSKRILGEYADRIVMVNEIYNSGLNNEQNLAVKFEENLRNQKPEDIYTICYTSGTTGTPKGAMIAQSCMMSALNESAVVMQGMAWEGDMLLSFLPMSHIFGRFESYTPYVLGFVQSFAENLDTIISNMQEVRPTIFLSVPRIFEKAYTRIMEMVHNDKPAKQLVFSWALGIGHKWLEEKRKNGKASIVVEAQFQIAKQLVFAKIQSRFGGRLRACLSGGAPLSNRIEDFMAIIGIPIYQGYGLTETCAPISTNTPQNNKAGTVGRLYPDVLVKIAEDGEILVKSAKVFKGYYKNPEETHEALRDGWFYTGDIGFLDEDGYLKITDRKKDLIKTAGGKFVAPQKIENMAKTSKVINQIVIYGDEKPYITALITLNQETVIKFAKEKKILTSNFSELIRTPEIKSYIQSSVDELNSELSRWEAIKKYHVLPLEFTVEGGELTPSMKVKRKYLTKKYQDTLESLY